MGAGSLMKGLKCCWVVRKEESGCDGVKFWKHRTHRKPGAKCYCDLGTINLDLEV